MLLLATRDMLPDPAEYELLIEEAWDRAVQRRREELKRWPMTKDHATCVSRRSFTFAMRDLTIAL